ncbi:hypothetical protein GCM10011383_14780 [Hymenobacter cavernae]|uniref:DUF2029 domain-containing protein n=1 Tax=Hymenobacter cavernae TaxID=2044852 RepID=A0ABQ1TYJ6_9BACT|nr:hypothetical protein GCM10011383_14780 [Hymenobacter cavernae]
MLVFLLALSVLASNAYVWLVNYVPLGDVSRYQLMALGHHDQVPAVHRYRVVVPLLARLVAEVLRSLRALFGPNAPSLPLGFSFYLVNTFLLALSGLLIYRTARVSGASAGPALLGMVAVLSSGLVTFVAGSALADSLPILVVALWLYALAARTGGWLLLGIICSLVAKEQLALMLPVVLFYGSFLSWPRRLGAVVLAGGLLLAVHYVVNVYYPLPGGNDQAEVLPVLLSHVQHHLLASLEFLASLDGIISLLLPFGGFNLLFVCGFMGGKAAIRTWSRRLPPGSAAMVGCVCLFMLLSSDISRMLLFAGPVFGVAVALIVEYHPWSCALWRRLAAPLR